MSDQFLRGWHLPPGSWPYSIQDVLQAVLQPAGPLKDAGAQSAVSSARPPSGGLFGTFAGQNASLGSGRIRSFERGTAFGERRTFRIIRPTR